jgi:hypothetical protein
VRKGDDSVVLGLNLRSHGARDLPFLRARRRTGDL